MSWELINLKTGIVTVLLNEKITIGRDKNSDVRLEETIVSRHHAILYLDKMAIFDTSVNGTEVNGSRIISYDYIKLRENDVIAFSTSKQLDMMFKLRKNNIIHSVEEEDVEIIKDPGEKDRWPVPFLDDFLINEE